MSARDPWKHHETSTIKVIDLAPAAIHWHAFCRTCGWQGRNHTTATDAAIDGDGHAIAMAGED